MQNAFEAIKRDNKIKRGKSGWKNVGKKYNQHISAVRPHNYCAEKQGDVIIFWKIFWNTYLIFFKKCKKSKHWNRKRLSEHITQLLRWKTGWRDFFLKNIPRWFKYLTNIEKRNIKKRIAAKEWNCHYWQTIQFYADKLNNVIIPSGIFF